MLKQKHSLAEKTSKSERKRKLELINVNNAGEDKKIPIKEEVKLENGEEVPAKKTKLSKHIDIPTLPGVQGFYETEKIDDDHQNSSDEEDSTVSIFDELNLISRSIIF